MFQIHGLRLTNVVGVGSNGPLRCAYFNGKTVVSVGFVVGSASDKLAIDCLCGCNSCCDRPPISSRSIFDGVVVVDRPPVSSRSIVAIGTTARDRLCW